MTLADQIIEHGPYAAGDMIRTWMLPPSLTADGLNALRDELIELRQLRAAAEARERYEITACAWNYDGAHLEMTCQRCNRTWTFDYPDDGPNELDNLAELVRRADQHTEDCP